MRARDRPELEQGHGPEIFPGCSDNSREFLKHFPDFPPETHSGDFKGVFQAGRGRAEPGEKNRGAPLVYRHLIAGRLVKLDKMARQLEPEWIRGYNRDSIKARGGFRENGEKGKEDCNPGDYHVEDKVLLSGHTLEELEQQEKPAYEYADWRKNVKQIAEADMDIQVLLSQGGLVRGRACCGKSW